MPLQEQLLGDDSQEGATITLTETDQKMESDREETEKSEHLKQKLEGDPQGATVPLTETAHIWEAISEASEDMD